MKALKILVIILLAACAKETTPVPVCHVDIPDVVTVDQVFTIDASGSENACRMLVETEFGTLNGDLVCDYSFSDPGVFRVRVTVFAANGWSDRCDYYVEVVDSLY